MNARCKAALRWACWLTVLSSGSLQAQLDHEAARFEDVQRIVAIGDVHGAYDAFAELLRTTGVTDSDGHWIGGATHLISLGDLLDRGPDSRAVMDELMQLQREAEDAGGQVHVVLGNHELMNLIGDLRYVSDAEYAAFADDETATERSDAFAALEASAAAAPTQAEFDAAYPPGYFAHRRAFAPDGRYGAWLLELPTIIVVNDWAYVHGGLGPTVVDSSLDEVNAATRSTLERYLKSRADLAASSYLPAFDMQQDAPRVDALLDSADLTADAKEALTDFQALIDAKPIGLDSPLWYRGNAYCKPLLETPILDAALAAIDADRVVVGHSPTQPRRVQTRLDGRVIMLDTGMLVSYYSGRPSALVIENGSAQVRYVDPDETVSLSEVDEVVAYGLSAATIQALLEQGQVQEFAWVAGTEKAELVLTWNGQSIPALFYPETAGDLELAADALDEQLQSGLIPPTIARTIDDTSGAVQFRFPDAVTETERLERQLGIAGWCPLDPQLAMMNTFDLLLYNRGRTRDNIVFNNGFSDLTLTAHGSAFGSERSLFPGFDPATLTIPTELVQTLRGLDEETLTADLGEWLDRRQIRALLSRRDRLLAND